jgi:hypothetical protein
MSNRRKVRGGVMASSRDLVTLPCRGCGEAFPLNTRLYATAVHDCETTGLLARRAGLSAVTAAKARDELVAAGAIEQRGRWYLMPRPLAEAIGSMTADEAAEWAGVPADDIRRMHQRAIRDRNRPGDGETDERALP